MQLGHLIIRLCDAGFGAIEAVRRLVGLVASGADAVNYRDGILGWCRNGLPLETSDKQATHAVHPYWRLFRVPDQYDVELTVPTTSEVQN